MINNSEIREVIDTVVKKAVLILGNFSDERIKILYQIRDELIKFGYLPLLFEFGKPMSIDTTETFITLAHISKFIVSDLSEQRSVTYELAHIIPRLLVPIKPIIFNQTQGTEQS
ncbi:MAG: hypothetical protein EA412_00985 [Chitinophagaceae bacterium]|nr:MAG: hypothetical protein EA412_00985 [Chitinophagaceae bacterium]